MLRYLFRSPRSIRVPLKNGQFNVQKVSVTQNSRISVSRVVTTLIISVCVVRTINHVFPDRDLKRGWERLKSKDWWAEHWRQAQRQTPTNGDSRTHPQDNNTIHLMLPIWVRRTPQTWYREDDPRWKAFQSFAQDKKLQDKIRLEIAHIIDHDPHTMETLFPYIKHLEARKVAVQMELIVPLQPPQHYEVPCIFIQQSGDVTYGWRRLPDSIGSKMDRIFHPVMLSQAFFAGCKAFANVTFLITTARLTDRMNTFRSQWDSASTKPVITESEEMKVNLRLPVTRASDEKLKKVLPFLRGEYGEHGSRQPYREMVRAMTYQGAIETGCAVFRSYWMVGQPNELVKNSDSVVQLEGLVLYIGDKGKLRLEVSAFYDVVAQGFVGKPVVSRISLVPNPERWHGTNSQSHDQIQNQRPQQIRQAATTSLNNTPHSDKPGSKRPTKSIEQPREPAATNSPPAKGQDK